MLKLNYDFIVSDETITIVVKTISIFFYFLILKLRIPSTMLSLVFTNIE